MLPLADWVEDHWSGRQVCILGVGNRLRGDDAAGPLLVDRLGGPDGRNLIDSGTTPENDLGVLLRRRPDVVVFVDAADMGVPPGTCAVAPVHDLAARASSTHTPSLRLLASILEESGIECWLLGIQPARSTPGRELHPAVAAAVDQAAEAMACLLRIEVSRG
jgi:hydrogenase 3 maturation protease